MEGWRTVRLGDVCDLIKRGIAPKYTENDGIPVVNQKCIRNHKIDFSLSRYHDLSRKKVPQDRMILPGDVLVNSTGVETLGRVAQVGEVLSCPATVDTHVTIVRPQKNLFVQSFFGYAMIFLEGEIASSGKGASGQIELARTALAENFKITYPQSFEEQQRIVSILEDAFTALAKAKENTERSCALSREFFESELATLSSSKNVGWNTLPLGNVCEVIKRGIAPKYAETEGVSVINQKCIRNHKVNISLARYHEDSKKKVPQEKIVLPGDVLVNSTGIGTLGRVAQVESFFTHPTTVDTHVTIVRPKKNIFAQKFFGYAMIFLEREIALSGKGTSGQTELARKALAEDFEIAYPPSLEDQQRIAAKLDDLSSQTKALEEKYQHKLAALEELKQSLLHRAFTGELTRNFRETERQLSEVGA